MTHKECSNHSLTLRLSFECEGPRGDVLETMGRSLNFFARLPRQALGSPEIIGAIGQLIPYNVLQNGLVLSARYDDFHANEALELYIASPGELTHRERVIISPQQAETGKVEHGLNDDEVAYLAGKEIEVYFTLPARGPGWTSPRRSYSVEGAP